MYLVCPCVSFGVEVSSQSVFVFGVTAVVSASLSAALNSDLAAFFAVLAQKHAARHQSLNESHRGKVVFAAQLFKAHNAVNRNSIFKQNQRRQHLNLQLLNKEGCLFCVQSHKPSFRVRHRNLLQMHVNNLAALEVLVEEGAHNVVCLGYRRQKLLLHNLCVRAMAERLVYLLLLVCFFAGS